MRDLPNPTAPLLITPFRAGRPTEAARALHANVAQRRRAQDGDAVLTTFEGVRQHLQTIADRIDRLRADYYVDNNVPELSQPQLDHLRAVSIALLVTMLDQTMPGQGARVARALFPDNVWVPPAADDDADIHNAITRPAELGLL